MHGSRKRFKFMKHKANSGRRKSLQLTSSGIIPEEEYETDDGDCNADTRESLETQREAHMHA